MKCYIVSANDLMQPDNPLQCYKIDRWRGIRNNFTPHCLYVSKTVPVKACNKKADKAAIVMVSSASSRWIASVLES